MYFWLQSVLFVHYSHHSPDLNTGEAGADPENHGFASEMVMLQRKAMCFMSEFLEFCVKFKK